MFHPDCKTISANVLRLDIYRRLKWHIKKQLIVSDAVAPGQPYDL